MIDLGGHTEPGPTPEMYTRWVQWGAFSPMVKKKHDFLCFFLFLLNTFLCFSFCSSARLHFPSLSLSYLCLLSLVFPLSYVNKHEHTFVFSFEHTAPKMQTISVKFGCIQINIILSWEMQWSYATNLFLCFIIWYDLSFISLSFVLSSFLIFCFSLSSLPSISLSLSFSFSLCFCCPCISISFLICSWKTFNNFLNRQNVHTTPV